MKMTRGMQYVLMFAVATVAILAAGWFFVLSPRIDSVSASRQHVAELEKSNQTLAASIAAMGRVDQSALKEQVSKLRTQVPGDLDLPDFTRQLGSLAQTTGVQVVSVERSEAAPANTSGTLAVPVTVSAEGDSASTLAFLRGVQHSNGRLLLVNGVSITPGGDERPYKISLDCSAFVYDDTAAAPATAAPNPSGPQPSAETKR